MDKINKAPLKTSYLTDTSLPLLDSTPESVHPHLPLLLPLCHCPYSSISPPFHTLRVCTLSPSVFLSLSLSTHSFLFISSSQLVSIHPESLPKCSVKGQQQNKKKIKTAWKQLASRCLSRWYQLLSVKGSIKNPLTLQPSLLPPSPPPPCLSLWNFCFYYKTFIFTMSKR